MKVIIVGGVAGGASAATRLRRLSEENEIVIFERSKNVSFANCGLPYYIGGVIQERTKLLLQTPKSFKDRFNVDVRIQTEILSINKKAKTVEAKNLATEEVYIESYDKLLLSPGASPFIPPLEGIHSDKILTLRNVEDMDKIILKTSNAKKVAVVGGGFIGLEIAESFLEKGLDVTIVEFSNQVMGVVDFEIASIIHKHVEEKGLKLILETAVEKFTEKGEKIVLSLSNGEEFEVDNAIFSIGVKPENGLAKAAGLEIGKTGGIAVNEFLQTSDKDIYAVGDAIEVTNFINGLKTLIPLAWPANRQGRIVADNITNGNEFSYKGSLGTSILKILDLNVSSVGLNEKFLKQHNYHYKTVTVSRGSRAGYYPNQTTIVLKILFNKKNGTIYGAQAIGKKGIDKRIDIIATAIKGRMKVTDLSNLELAYAPPFNSAKDPVNIAGYVAENIINGELEMINYDEVSIYQNKENHLFLDVRTKEENERGAISNSLNIDLNTLRGKLDTLDKSKTYIIYCQVGLRGYLAHRILKNNGFNCKNLNGGYSIWSKVQ